MKTIAIVTGATSGIGREFVRQLDGAYYGQIDEFWAVGRSQERLAELAESTYAPVRGFALDLTQPSAIDELRCALASEDDVRVSWLVNSAGFGRFGRYGRYDETPGGREDAGMLRLNCLALVEMCDMTLPYMFAGSRIVNMASVAAYLPVSPMGTYAATKRFVLDLTRTLNFDLLGTGIHACAVCPKAVRTSFWKEAGKERSVGFTFGTERAYDVVRKAIRAVNFGRGAIITSPDMKLVCGAAKVLPYGVLQCAVRVAQTAADGVAKVGKRIEEETESLRSR